MRSFAPSSARLVDAKASVIRSVLGRVRDLAESSHVRAKGRDSKLVNTVTSQSKSVPKSWVRSVPKFSVEKATNGRGCWKGYNRRLEIRSSADKSTALHELTHAVDQTYIPPHQRVLRSQFSMSKMEQAFQKSRLRPGEKLSEIYKGSGEMGYRDEWASHYMGRIYDDGTGEVMTTGMEGVFYSKYALDDSHRRFVLGMLAGF